MSYLFEIFLTCFKCLQITVVYRGMWKAVWKGDYKINVEGANNGNWSIVHGLESKLTLSPKGICHRPSSMCTKQVYAFHFASAAFKALALIQNCTFTPCCQTPIHPNGKPELNWTSIIAQSQSSSPQPQSQFGGTQNFSITEFVNWKEIFSLPLSIQVLLGVTQRPEWFVLYTELKLNLSHSNWLNDLYCRYIRKIPIVLQNHLKGIKAEWFLQQLHSNIKQISHIFPFFFKPYVATFWHLSGKKRPWYSFYWCWKWTSQFHKKLYSQKAFSLNPKYTFIRFLSRLFVMFFEQTPTNSSGMFLSCWRYRNDVNIIC